MTSTNDLDALEPIERDLQAAFAAPVPALRFAAGHAEDPREQAMLRRRPVRLGLGVAVVTGALVATLVWLPAIGGAGTATVNARELIDRAGHANAAMASVAPAYHLRRSSKSTASPPGPRHGSPAPPGRGRRRRAQWTASR